MLDLDLTQEIAALRTTFRDIRAVVDVDALEAEIARLSEQAGAPDLWDDTEKAQKVTSALSHRQSELARVKSIDLASTTSRCSSSSRSEAGDEETASEARVELASLQKAIGDLEVQTLLDGEWDDRPAVITIRAGAGGVDAADFAEMLMRMYLRWAEKHGYNATVMDTSYAEEAGIKSATFEIDAPYAFGTLSVEAGTHRLVRMSPFGAAGKRQTSFAAVEVIPLMEEAAGDRDPRERHPRRRLPLERPRRPVGQHHRLRRAHHPPPDRHGRVDAEREVADPEPRRRHARAGVPAAPAAEGAGGGAEEGARGQHHRELGRPDALLRARAVPDGEGPAHRLRGRQPGHVFDGDLDGFIAAGIKWRKREIED